MEVLLFLVVGIGLYLFSDWLLNRIEIRYGDRFEHRSLFFFAIFLSLTVLVFAGLRRWLGI